jgi:hypothetical protein
MIGITISLIMLIALMMMQMWRVAAWNLMAMQDVYRWYFR